MAQRPPLRCGPPPRRRARQACPGATSPAPARGPPPPRPRHPPHLRHLPPPHGIEHGRVDLLRAATLPRCSGPPTPRHGGPPPPPRVALLRCGEEEAGVRGSGPRRRSPWPARRADPRAALGRPLERMNFGCGFFYCASPKSENWVLCLGCIVGVSLRMFTCLSNLKQSCSKFYKEPKLFYDHLIKMCRTCSKRAHKLVLRSIWRL